MAQRQVRREKQSFNDFIQEERKKKKNEELANDILGHGRKSSQPPPQRDIGGSLSSRSGVKKVGAKNPQALEASNALNKSSKRSSSATPRLDRPLNNRTRRLVRPPENEMRVRGLAAAVPTVVVASNFAPGTTAADVKHSMEKLGLDILDCYLISSQPTVIAELIFGDEDDAEEAIAVYNNRLADGRLLYVYKKRGGPSPRLPSLNSAPELPTQARLWHNRIAALTEDMMDVDNGQRNARLNARSRSPERRDANDGSEFLAIRHRDYLRERAGRDTIGKSESTPRDIPTGPRRGRPTFRR